jgi:hypothetical protein
MKIEHRDKPYGSGGDNHDMENGFDYMLFRQDWGGTERVYFNKEDINKVIEAIEEGTIPIHPNYSILYTRSEDLLNEGPDFGCYATVK